MTAMQSTLLFAGAAGMVTGSNFLLDTGGAKFLVDCGLQQGMEEDKNWEEFPYNPSEISHLIVTHAHVDHVGRIPRLVKKGFKVFEGTLIFFLTLGGVGIALWFLWNLIIFKDPFYFVFGPFSARYQQLQLESAGNLPTKGNIFLSFQIYLYALFYNSITTTALVGLLAGVYMFLDKKLSFDVRISSLTLISPLIFNILWQKKKSKSCQRKQGRN